MAGYDLRWENLAAGVCATMLSVTSLDGTVCQPHRYTMLPYGISVFRCTSSHVFFHRKHASRHVTFQTTADQSQRYLIGRSGTRQGVSLNVNVFLKPCVPNCHWVRGLRQGPQWTLLDLSPRQSGCAHREPNPVRACVCPAERHRLRVHFVRHYLHRYREGPECGRVDSFL